MMWLVPETNTYTTFRIGYVNYMNLGTTILTNLYTYAIQL